MKLKTAALLALIGMILLSVLLAVGFIRDVSAFLSGGVAVVTVVHSLIHLLASLGVAVFMYVFYRAQSCTRPPQHRHLLPFIAETSLEAHLGRLWLVSAPA